MKICAISDTHTHHDQIKIPACDILIHAGDFCSHGIVEEADNFLDWFSNQRNAKHKIFIAGNHDHCMQTDKDRITIPGNVIYLCDTSITVEGLSIHGTPWTPYFYDWAFQGIDCDKGGLRTAREYVGGPHMNAVPTEKYPLLDSKYGLVPNGVDILVSHGPPFGILDRNGQGDNCGSHSLLRAIESRAPKYSIFGHIHEGAGMVSHKGNFCCNAASLDGNYELYDDPCTTFEVKK